MVRESRKAKSLPLLKLLGHEISKADWISEDKAVFWSACLIAFFGSLRLGEFLAKNERKFNPSETLLWQDMTLRDDSLSMLIKIPKNRTKNGEIVDIFSCLGHNCCPIAAIKLLEGIIHGSLYPNLPVFSFSNGVLLTPAYLTSFVQSFLFTHIGKSAFLISGHSFRAALPSTLSNCPELGKDEEIKLWGRWSSPSYKLYTRLKLEKRRAIFSKFVSAFNRSSQ